MNQKKIVGMLIVTFLFFIGIMLIGPFDFFSHGFFCDTVNYEEIDDIQEYQELGTTPFEQDFMPLHKHFKGFEINLTNTSSASSGELVFTVNDMQNRVIDEKKVQIADITPLTWYEVHMNETLKVGKEYHLVICAEGCATTPYLQVVDKAYLPNENLSGNLLLGYAYAKSTFTLSEKFLICAFAVIVWILLMNRIVCSEKYYIRIRNGVLFFALSIVLTWNYMYNTFGSPKVDFDKFDVVSESLVVGVIEAENKGVNLGKYGIGEYADFRGDYYRNKRDYSYIYNPNQIYFSDDGYFSYYPNGYSNEAPAILVPRSFYTEQICNAGNIVEFSNGEKFHITEVGEYGNFFVLLLDSRDMLTYARYGNIADMRIKGSNGEEFPYGGLIPYNQQYGLQGRVFRHLSRYIEYEYVYECLHLICCLLLSAVVMVLSFLLHKKYNMLFAVCFYLTMLLAPVVTAFARNLYWVEFTWFLPMLVGLLCSIKVNNKKIRVMCYVAAFVSILVKCLCGYEFVTTVMMGLVVFLITDLGSAIFEKDRCRAMFLLKTTIMVGVMALIGFVTAFCIHAMLRGEGNLFEGIQTIIKTDALRRTLGGEAGLYDAGCAESINASIWETLQMYFHFDGEIVIGIESCLFPLLCVAPIAVMVWNCLQQKLQMEDVFLYVICFLTSISWFVLGKAHSYLHIGFNYVLWYFGFIQVCFYILLKQIAGKWGRKE